MDLCLLKSKIDGNEKTYLYFHVKNRVDPSEILGNISKFLLGWGCPFCRHTQRYLEFSTQAESCRSRQERAHCGTIVPLLVPTAKLSGRVLTGVSVGSFPSLGKWKDREGGSISWHCSTWLGSLGLGAILSVHHAAIPLLFTSR